MKNQLKAPSNRRIFAFFASKLGSRNQTPMSYFLPEQPK